MSTRLPPEFRLPAAYAIRLLEEEVFARLTVHDLPAADRLPLLKAVTEDGAVGGRI